MNLAFLALLPAALLIDRLFGELPSRVHPVCMMGALASRMEALLRRGPNNVLMSLSGTHPACRPALCRSRGRSSVGRAGLRRPPGCMVRVGHHHLDLRRAPEP